MRRLGAVALIAAVLQAAAHSTQQPVVLELRVFDGTEEVTSQTRITLHRAGDRGEPVAQTNTGTHRIEFSVTEGLYDAQAIRESGGNVVSIRWANRLVVMRYPDEGGRHLEVVNFRNGFGALQIRVANGTRPAVAVYPAGNRTREAPGARSGDSYALYVVPAGKYDIFVKDPKPAWHPELEVPLDRTRLWVIPGPDTERTR